MIIFIIQCFNIMLFLKVKSTPSVLEFSTLAIDTTMSWTNSFKNLTSRWLPNF